MALALDQLVFSVDSTQLDEARIKIAKLGDAVAALNKPLQDMSRSSAKTNEVIAKSELAAEKARVATKALADTTGQVKDKVDPLAKLIEKLSNNYTDMASGFTKGESSILNQARNLGIFGSELQPVIALLEKIKTLNKDPFDASLGGVRSITQEFEKLQQRANLAAQGIMLTSKQLGEYSKLAAEAAGKVEGMGFDPKSGEGLNKYNQLLAESQNKYLEIVASVNKLTQAEKDRNDALKQQERLLASNKAISDAMIREVAGQVGQKSPELQQMAEFYKKQELAARQLTAAEDDLILREQKLAFVNKELAAGLSTASANALFKYQKDLEALGKSADEVSRRMTAFRAGLVERQGHSPFTKLTQEAETTNKRLDHLSRALGPQITDIFVGLATGQSLLTVALQQGGQIRDQIALAGVASSDMGKALSTAAVQMVGSLKDVAVAMGSLLITPFIAGGKAVTDFATKIVFANKTIQAHSLAVAISADSGNKLASFLVGAFSKIPMLIGAAAASVTIFAGIALAAFFSVEKQMKSLTTSLILTGGSLGLTTDSAIRMAQSMEQVGVSSSKAMTVMTAMAKQGGFASREIELVTKSAVDMQKWLGVSVEDTVKQFSKLKGEPVEALIEIAKQTGLVDSATLATVISLAEQGRTAEAAAIAMKSYGDVTVAQVQRAKQEYTEFAQLMIGIGEGLGKFWDNVKSLWIKAAPGVQLTDQIDKINMRLRGGFLSDDHRKQLEDQRKVLTDQYMILEKKRLNEEQSLVLNTESAKVMESAFKTTSQYLTGINKLEFERTAAINQQEKIKSQFQKSEISQEAYVAGMIASSVKLAKINDDVAKENKKNSSEATTAANKHQDEIKKAINVYEDIVGISDGVTKSYNEQVAALKLLGKEGTKSPEQIAEALGKLEEQQPRFKALVKDFEDYDKAMQAHLGVMKEYKDLNTESSAQLEFRASLLGKTTEEQRLLTIENEKSVALLKAQVKYEKELKALTDSGLTGETLETSKLNLTKEYETQRVLIAKDANLKIAEDYQKQFEAIQKELGDVMFLALTNRGAQAGKKLRDLIKAELMKPITLVVNAVVNAIFGDAIGSVVKGGGSIGGLVSAGSSLFSSSSSLGGSVISAGNQLGRSLYDLGFEDAGEALVNTFNSVSESGQAISSSIDFASDALGYLSAFNTALKNPYAGAGQAIGQYFGGPLGAYVGGEIGKAVGDLMGYSGGDPDAFLVQRSHASQNKSSYDMSRSTAFGEIGFVDGTGYINKGNGVISEYGETEDVSREFRQTVLDTFSALDAEIARTLTAGQIAKVSKELEGWYKKSWSFEGNMIEDWVAARYEKILQVLDQDFTSLRDFTKEGEKLTDTAVRLITTFGTVSNVFTNLGMDAEKLSYVTANAYVEAFGSLENFRTATSYFYDNFFTEQEKTTRLTEQLTSVFSALGKQLPSTKQEFRDIVTEFQNLGNIAAVSVLLGIQDEFVDFISVTEEASTAFKELTASLLEEVNRLRGAILGDASISGNVSGLSAEFAILTAQAKSGNITALEKLPEYSQAIEQAVAASAVNASDVAYARAWLAESLGTTSNVITGIEPSTAGSMFTQDVATPTAVNGATALTASSGSQADLIAALVAEVQGLRAEVRADVAANNKTAKILERANQDGETISVTVAA